MPHSRQARGCPPSRTADLVRYAAARCRCRDGLRRARRFALATRPATCRSGKTHIEPIQPIITNPGFEIFAMQKSQNRTRHRVLPGRRRQSPREAMPHSRQAGLPALSGGRPCALRGLIFNQAPIAGRVAHNCLRRARRFALATRPGSTRWRIPPIEQIN